jgi:hypothetical protein
VQQNLFLESFKETWLKRSSPVVPHITKSSTGFTTLYNTSLKFLGNGALSRARTLQQPSLVEALQGTTTPSTNLIKLFSKFSQSYRGKCATQPSANSSIPWKLFVKKCDVQQNPAQDSLIEGLYSYLFSPKLLLHIAPFLKRSGAMCNKTLPQIHSESTELSTTRSLQNSLLHIALFLKISGAMCNTTILAQIHSDLTELSIPRFSPKLFVA